MRAPLAALLALLGTLVLGMWIGGHSSLLPAPIRDAVRGDDEMQVVAEAIDRVHEDYYREIPRRELADRAIDGIFKDLDQFSAYFDPAEFTQFQQRSSARFSGIGVTVQKVRDGLRIGEVYDDSPARRAGLRAGDVIVAADGQRLAGRPEEAASSLVRGKAGTQVALRIRRGRKRLERRVGRAELSVPVVETARRERGGRTFAVVSLATFGRPGVHGEVYAAVQQALKDRVDGLVLDLRGNPGGLVDEARLVASAFLPEGEIVTTRGRSRPPQVYRASGDPIAPRLPMVVLVDRGSASASEIVAGALQDRGRAKVVGTQTFGKGVFQENVELPNGGAINLTAGQYFTPKGRNLGRGVEQGAGIPPDVRARDDPKTRRDEALARAVSVLAGS